MKRLSQLLALTLALVMALGLAACGGTDEPQESGTEPDTTGSGTPSAETYVVGICQQMTHDALDAATQGFKDALTEKLGAMLWNSRRVMPAVSIPTARPSWTALLRRVWI